MMPLQALTFITALPISTVSPMRTYPPKSTIFFYSLLRCLHQRLFLDIGICQISNIIQGMHIYLVCKHLFSQKMFSKQKLGQTLLFLYICFTWCDKTNANGNGRMVMQINHFYSGYCFHQVDCSSNAPVPGEIHLEMFTSWHKSCLIMQLRL